MQTIQGRYLLSSINFPACLGLSENHAPKTWCLIFIFVFSYSTCHELGYISFSVCKHNPSSPCLHLGHSRCHYSPECPQPPKGGGTSQSLWWHIVTRLSSFLRLGFVHPQTQLDISGYFWMCLIGDQRALMQRARRIPSFVCLAIELGFCPTRHGWRGRILRYIFSDSIWNVWI